MAKINIGYLLKKKQVNYQNKEYEIFELVDYTTCISFINVNGSKLYNVTSGNYSGIYASKLTNDKNEREYIFINQDLEETIEHNNNIVNFNKMRENEISSKAKYYFRSQNDKTLNPIKNEDLINYLEKEKTNRF